MGLSYLLGLFFLRLPVAGHAVLADGVGSSLAGLGGEGSSLVGRRRGSSAAGRWTVSSLALPIWSETPGRRGFIRQEIFMLNPDLDRTH